jgi:hypothetical protein
LTNQAIKAIAAGRPFLPNLAVFQQSAGGSVNSWLPTKRRAPDFLPVFLSSPQQPLATSRIANRPQTPGSFHSLSGHTIAIILNRARTPSHSNLHQFTNTDNVSCIGGTPL